MIDKLKYSQELEKLRAFSYKLKLASDDKNELVNQLNAISKESRTRLFENYKNLEGPVKVIRKEVSEVLNSKNIQLQELQGIVDRAMQANPKSFGRMYKSWYNMLYMFLIADFRDEMNAAVEFISNSTIEELGAKENILAKKFDFTGERETGSTRCWIAIINKTHASQKTAKQLFINIENGEIEYSFYDRPHEVKKDQVILKNITEFNFDNFILVFKNHLLDILNDIWVQKTSYWRLGSKDEDQSYWEEMLAENKVCIGWSKIGDLNESDIKNKKNIAKLFDENDYYVDDNSTKGKKAGEIFNFFETIQEQDIVLVQDGSRVLGIGKIKGPYEYNENSGFPHQRAIDWLVISPPLSNGIGLRTTVYQISDENKILEIERLLKDSLIATKLTTKLKSKMNNSLNQILYGPPGTGKTYNSINRAIEIINPAFNLSQDRTIVKAEFDRLEKNGQILFTTFHQSMSYEDFIEGIKPETIDKRVMYDTQNGIFKILANRALFSFYKSTNTTTLREFESFDQIYDAYLENLGSRLANKTDRLLLPLRSKNYFVEVLSIDDTSIETKGASAANKAFVEKEKLRLLYNKFKSVEDIKNVSEDIRAVGRGLGWSSNYYGIFKDFKEYENNTLKEDKKAIPETVKTLSDEQIEAYLTSLPDKYNVSFESNPENFVLIIDEINRGNISQIFGELITLIEDDKRAGKPEALAITLPYSKEKLSIPPNLYIVGTMNTADRSVEALDTALRRRFSFEEMAPKPELLSPTEMLRRFWWTHTDEYSGTREVYEKYESEISKLLGLNVINWDKYTKYGNNENNTFSKKEFEDNLKNVISFNGINLQLLLQTINTRIEKLLDKDHLIGHSFFMHVFSLKELEDCFYDKIIPLLQEYFFGDFGKIGLVLGKGFVNIKTNDENEDVFAEFDHDSKSDFNQREVFEIIDYRTRKTGDLVNQAEMNFEEAIHLLLKRKSA